MTQEEKQLVLIDLSARLPYGTICRCRTTEDSTWWNTDHHIFGIIGNKFDVGSDILDAEQIKPYLRPMSSMTKEEEDELYTAMDWYGEIDEAGNVYTKGQEKVYRETFYEYTDWLNAHHFDYRGLIPMGLALEAPEDMYKTE